jgi:hypothetical protein
LPTAPIPGSHWIRSKLNPKSRCQLTPSSSETNLQSPTVADRRRRVSSTRRARPGALASCRAHEGHLCGRPDINHPFPPPPSLSFAKGKEPSRHSPFFSDELDREPRHTTGRLSSPVPPPRHPPPPGPTETHDWTLGELHYLLLRLRGVAGARHGTSPWSGCFGPVSISPYSQNGTTLPR